MQGGSNKQLEYLTEHYRELVDQVFRFAYIKTNSKETAEDITSECFLSTIRYIQEHDVRNIRAFLFSAVRNKIIDYYRQKDRIIYSDEVVLANEQGSDVNDMIIAQDAKLVIEKMAMLPDADREVLTLRFVEDMDIGEIAEIIGKSNVATRVQIFRALKKAQALIMGENNQ